VATVDGFDAFLMDKADVRAAARDEREKQRVTEGLESLSEVLNAGAPFWVSLRAFATGKKLATSDEEAALSAACSMPKRIPTDKQAAKLLVLKQKCVEAGFVGS
jgi:hypothetical protein